MTVHARKMLLRLALSALAVLCVFAPHAAANGVPPSCTIAAVSAPNVRHEGFRELLGDVDITCTGGTPTGNGVAIPTYDINVTFTNADYGWTYVATDFIDMVLVVNPAVASSVGYFPCLAANGVCPGTGNGTGTGYYGAGAGQNRNVFQAQAAGTQIGFPTATFRSIPIDPPGTTGAQVLRIRNLRGNIVFSGPNGPQAPRAVSGKTELRFVEIQLPTPITAAVEVRSSSEQVLLVSQPSLVVARDTGLGLSAAVRNPSDSDGGAMAFTRSTPVNAALAASQTASGQISMNLKYTETQADSFRTQSQEDGFSSPSFPATNGLDKVGKASTGTRLFAYFSNIPANVSLYVTTTQVSTGTTSGATATLTASDGGGGGAFSAVAGTGNASISGSAPFSSIKKVTLTNGGGIAAWDVRASSPATVESISFGVVAAHDYSVAVPAVGSASVNMSLGPIDPALLIPAELPTNLPIPFFDNPFSFQSLFTMGAGIPAIIGSSPLPTAISGSSYVPYAFGVLDPPGNPKWEASGLPVGMSISAAGVLSGTPAGPGIYPTIIQVSFGGEPISKPFTLPVFGISTPAPLQSPVSGVAYSQTLTAVAGAPPYTWSMASGSLPAGLTLSASGVISGTTTATSSSAFMIRVTDAASRSVTASYTLFPLSLSPLSLPNPAVGVPYSRTITASGGVPPLLSMFSGSLPVGLTFTASTGTVSGTATLTGATTINIMASDSQGAQITRSYTLSPLKITTPSLPNGQVGVAYPATTLAAAGGTAPYTFSAGTLPAGLSLSPAGVLSGTPASTAAATFTVTATDSASPQVAHSASFTITPLAGVLAIATTSPLPNPGVGTVYSKTLAAAGGSPPYTWSVSAGALPAGLTLGTNGVLSGTATSTSPATFTVKVTDAIEGTATKEFTALSPFSLAPAALPNPVVGTAYSQTLTASGGAAPFAFSVSSGLPTGLNLSAAGALSGTAQGRNGGASLLYGGTKSGQLLTINAATGAGTLVGITPPLSSTEIVFDSLTGRAWSQQIDGTFTIREFDIATAAAIGGVVPDIAAFNGLEYVGTTLYGTTVSNSEGPSTLRTLNPVTGASAPIGLTGTGPIAGLAYDKQAGIMYGIQGGSPPGQPVHDQPLDRGRDRRREHGSAIREPGVWSRREPLRRKQRWRGTIDSVSNQSLDRGRDAGGQYRLQPTDRSDLGPRIWRVHHRSDGDGRERRHAYATVHD